MSEEKKVTFGLTEKAAYILIYLFGWISGLIFYLSEKEDKTIRLHALQALIFSAAFFILIWIFYFIPFFWLFIIPIFWVLYWVVIVIAIVRACNGNILKIPVVYDIAEKHA